MKKAWPLLVLSLFIYSSLFAQGKDENIKVEKRQYTTQKIENNSIDLDGIPDDAVWAKVPWSEGFIQYQPRENTDPYQQTHFKVLYDNKYLYIAYECLDIAPDSIVRRMGRRDDFPGDWVEVNIDSYHDKRTAFSFTTSVSGVRGDEFVSLDGNNWDANWNPVWYARTDINNKGWTAEIKIPFSQLRYGDEKEKVWGIQVQRRIFRKDERSTWQYIPQSSGVWVSGFGELRGLNDLPYQKQVEIAPYVVAQTSKYPKQDGNPFATGSDSKLSAGVDGKVAVTSDLILDFTINPDFGQVEADPSQVRIDGFQSFFDEHRPFFIESSNIFNYQLTGSLAGGDYDADLLFYSRRIGSTPHVTPTLVSGEYASEPDKTAILGAAKFSGKTKNGWSIGILESATQRVMADIDKGGIRSKELVEPLTSYFVGRVQKDINNGNTVLGGILTAVNRENGLNDLIRSRAYTGGFDFLHYWKNKTWYYKGDAIFSRVEGSAQSIYNTQTAFEHLFQRSNMSVVKLNPTRTSLTGTGGTFRIGKSGGKNDELGRVIKCDAGVTWRSPQLELNDIGFMLSSNEINHFFWAGILYQQPFSIFRSARMSYNHWSRWDFDGQFLYQAFDVNAHGVFKNYWSAGVGLDYNPYEVSNTALRGGSSLRKPPGGGNFFYINSDGRKKLVASLNVSNAMGFEHTVLYNDYSLGITAQPMNAFNVSLSAGYNNFWRRQDQYVTTVSFGSDKRILTGEVSQKTIRFTLRINYNITPDLTIQYYGQPFITRLRYSNFAYVKDPLNANYNDRFHKFSDKEISYANNQYSVDENGDGLVDYVFDKPDLNFVQFRSNLILRWEYKPGSEFYLVWSQGNTPDVSRDLDSPLPNSLFGNVFNDQAMNIFLLKFTYRFLK